MKPFVPLAPFLALAAVAAQASPPSPHLEFALTPEQITAQCEAAVARAGKRLDDLASMSDGERSFTNTVVAFDYIQSDLETETSSETFLKYVSPDKAVRDAGHECETQVEKYNVDIYTRPDLYQAIRGYAAKGEALSGADAKLLERTIEDFRRNGLDLPPLDRARYKLLKTHLVEMESTFSKNLNEVDDLLVVSRKELEGLPQDYIDRLERTEDGAFKVTLNYPDYFPFMRNARDEDARRRLDSLMKNRAYPDNVALLEEILDLRLRLAKMLGYTSHAQYVLVQRMAKDPQTVNAFLERMHDRLTQKAQPELARMADLKLKDDPQSKGIRSWDYFYYHNQLKKTLYAVDDEEVKAYFPLDKVTAGMFELYQHLLGVIFDEVVPAEAWHADVRQFEVRDAQSKALIGHFYMDLFPREGKYKHAAAFTLVGGRAEPGGAYRHPVAAIVANFNPPGKDLPSLLKHGEVETYFHEFGHIMHQVLTQASYPRFAGTRVARDFVEAPSQMLENWVWEKDILRRISGHYRTGEPLPEDVLKRMVEAKNLDSGMRYLRQVFYATVDQTYHDSKLDTDTSDTYRRLYNAITLAPLAPDTHPEASFGHLMGYAASYYGYMWSEVFAADMFSVFEKRGILDSDLGRRYRETILEPGGGRDEAELVRTFLGREPSEDAFLHSIGLE
jgi:thimet oligopeptidase